jgi:hypothetical protein
MNDETHPGVQIEHRYRVADAERPGEIADSAPLSAVSPAQVTLASTVDT